MGTLLQPQIEAQISKLLGKHKEAVYRGITQNYDDITVHYMDWRKDEMDTLYLRAGKGEVDDVGNQTPNFLNWQTMLKDIFKPIRKYMDEETGKYKKELEERKQEAKNKKNLT